MSTGRIYTERDSKIGFGLKRKLSRFDDRKPINIKNIDRFTIVESRGFGSTENPIFESRSVYFQTKRFLFFEQVHTIRFFYLKSWRFALLDMSLCTLYLFSNPFRISRRFYQSRGEKNIYAYGETPLSVWAEVAKKALIGPEDRFYDLGCGRGRLVFWTHYWVGCAAVGIDWTDHFIRKARWIRTLWRQRVRFFSQRLNQSSFQDATVIYLYTYHPDEEWLDFSKLSSGARVITVSEPLSVEGFLPVSSIKARFPWGETDVFINKKL